MIDVIEKESNIYDRNRQGEYRDGNKHKVHELAK